MSASVNTKIKDTARCARTAVRFNCKISNFHILHSHYMIIIILRLNINDSRETTILLHSYFIRDFKIMQRPKKHLCFRKKRL